MIRISTEKELLDAFRPIDREEVELPRDLKFPFALNHYVSWLQPAGARVYLVCLDPDKRVPFGIVFRRDQSGGAHAAMCEWCHSVRDGEGVGLLTATASPKRRVGLNLCRDLSCRKKVESAPGPNDMPQTVFAREKLVEITRRMFEFARQQLI